MSYYCLALKTLKADYIQTVYYVTVPSFTPNFKQFLEGKYSDLLLSKSSDHFYWSDNWWFYLITMGKISVDMLRCKAFLFLLVEWWISHFWSRKSNFTINWGVISVYLKVLFWNRKPLTFGLIIKAYYHKINGPNSYNVVCQKQLVPLKNRSPTHIILFTMIRCCMEPYIV